MKFDWNTLAFLVFPYLSLAVFTVGHAWRYLTDPFHWNAKSSEILEKGSLKYASPLFHYGIVLTFIGHFGGLLIPQTIYDAVGIDADEHTRIAIVLGMVFGVMSLSGVMLLLWRRRAKDRVAAATTANDTVTLALLLFVILVGTYNVFYGHYHLLDTVAPWIRSIVFFSPNPELMADVPFAYQLHILAALLLFAFSPFSRLIHIWSLPVQYLPRSYLLFRRRADDC